LIDRQDGRVEILLPLSTRSLNTVLKEYRNGV